MRTKRSASTSSNSSTVSTKKIKLSPMDMLVEAAKSINPRQFELPKEMARPCIFPGTDKIETCSKKRNRSTLNLLSEKCYICKKTCRTAPLLACDYCPLFFHLDCLDPPLTAFPAGRWMCPNHVEQFLDSSMLSSISATERVRLWDQYQGPVDQEVIKMDFFRKIHRKNPPFRVRVKLKTRNKATIPLMIKQHYASPVELLPSLRDVLRLETVRQREFFKPSEIKTESLDSEYENAESTDECDIIDIIPKAVNSVYSVDIVRKSDDTETSNNASQELVKVNGVLDLNGDTNLLNEAIQKADVKNNVWKAGDLDPSACEDAVFSEKSKKYDKKAVENHCGEEKCHSQDLVKEEDICTVPNGTINGICSPELHIKSEFPSYLDVNGMYKIINV